VPVRPHERPSIGEEIANGVTHGVGAVLSVAALALMAAFAAVHGDAWHVVACSIFGTTLVILYAASSLYHSIPMPRAKDVFRVLDHSAIFLLIAGTYTPFTLVALRGPWGWAMFGVIWGLAILGVLFEATPVKVPRGVSIALYIVMGWAVVVAFKPLAAALPRGGLVLVFSGGAAYTGGLAFYGWRRLPYNHAVWHLFVLAGSVLHVLAVLLYVIPVLGTVPDSP
jgi:hemolysin III